LRTELTKRSECSAANSGIILEGKTVEAWPLVGGKNWHPMSYNPLSQLIYVNTMAFGWEYPPLPVSKRDRVVERAFRSARVENPGTIDAPVVRLVIVKSSR
jgi:hypothetical protein